MFWFVLILSLIKSILYLNLFLTFMDLFMFLIYLFSAQQFVTTLININNHKHTKYYLLDVERPLLQVPSLVTAFY